MKSYYPGNSPVSAKVSSQVSSIVNSRSAETLVDLIGGAASRRTAFDLHDTLLASVLDQMACALLIVDRPRNILYANAAGHAELHQGVYLRDQDGVLTSTPHARPMLNLVIATALHQADDSTPVDRSRLRHVVLSDEEGRSRIAYVRALVSPEAGPGGRGRTQALITLPAMNQITEGCAAAFAQLYCLTPTEQRVLVHVANGATLKATGAALRIAAATVTTHLKHIFDKTGARRQSEVVALFLRSLPPLAR